MSWGQVEIGAGPTPLPCDFSQGLAEPALNPPARGRHLKSLHTSTTSPPQHEERASAPHHLTRPQIRQRLPQQTTARKRSFLGCGGRTSPVYLPSCPVLPPTAIRAMIGVEAGFGPGRDCSCRIRPRGSGRDQSGCERGRPRGRSDRRRAARSRRRCRGVGRLPDRRPPFHPAHTRGDPLRGRPRAR